MALTAGDYADRRHPQLKPGRAGLLAWAGLIHQETDMPSRTQLPEPPRKGRDPTQTSPDDDEAQVGEQTHLDSQEPPPPARERRRDEPVEDEAKAAGP